MQNVIHRNAGDSGGARRGASQEYLGPTQKNNFVFPYVNAKNRLN